MTRATHLLTYLIVTPIRSLPWILHGADVARSPFECSVPFSDRTADSLGSYSATAVEYAQRGEPLISTRHCVRAYVTLLCRAQLATAVSPFPSFCAPCPSSCCSPLNSWRWNLCVSPSSRRSSRCSRSQQRMPQHHPLLSVSLSSLRRHSSLLLLPSLRPVTPRNRIDAFPLLECRSRCKRKSQIKYVAA